MSEIKRLAILWAPWRIKYIESPRTGACIFCISGETTKDRENLVLYRGSKSFIIMNRYPYNTGHLMIAPYRHVGDLLELSEEELLDLVRNVNLSVKVLKEVLKPEGFNIGINMGKVAGAGIEDHLHVHVVPRWVGDTNFMPTIAQVKVIPELLEATYDKLRSYLLRLLEERTPDEDRNFHEK